MATVDKRYSAVLGPVKLEVLDLSSVSDADTVTTLMQNPTEAVGISKDDDNNTVGVVQCSISTKTITLNNSNLSSSDVLVIVFGF